MPPLPVGASPPDNQSNPLQYSNGRTETVRSCSVESKAFVMSGAADLATRRQLLLKAMESQTNYMIEASAGKGVDRHLMGLRLCLTAVRRERERERERERASNGRPPLTTHSRVPPCAG